MKCDCIETVDKKLAEMNLALDTSFVFSSGAELTISTHWKDAAKKQRGKKPTTIIVTFCPFCGTRAANER